MLPEIDLIPRFTPEGEDPQAWWNELRKTCLEQGQKRVIESHDWHHAPVWREGTDLRWPEGYKHPVWDAMGKGGDIDRIEQELIVGSYATR